jgi:hypothetical protein
MCHFKKVLVILAFFCAIPTANAQPRSREVCTTTHTTLAQYVADETETAVPRMVAIENGAVVAWRERGGSLRLAAFDTGWRVAGENREIARDVSTFSMTATSNGVAVAYVTHNQDMFLARVNGRGEAQNVPRRIAHEEGGVRDVVLTQTDTGLFVVWTPPRTNMLHGMVLDARGVPHGHALEFGTGVATVLQWIPTFSTVSLLMSGTTATDEPTLLFLTPAGEVISRTRWPVGVRGPFDLSGDLYALQTKANGDFELQRVAPNGSLSNVTETTVRYVFVDTVATTDGVLVLFRDGQTQRLITTRVTPEGRTVFTTLLRLGTTQPASLAVRENGTSLMIHREPGTHNSARLVVSQLVCPR